MSIREGLLNVERKWAWSFFGFLLAIIFGGIAIYTSFFQDKNPNLQVILESRTSVLDIKEDIKSLEILYKGINIKEQHKYLNIMTVKIKNNSNVTILKEFYDDLSPLKIEIKGAEIVDKPQIIETSNNYLREFTNIELDSNGRVYLPKLIIEGQEFYTISLLLLYNVDSIPKVVASGKIAGQIKNIRVIENYQATVKQSFWNKLMVGSIWIHFVRFIFYLLAIFIVFLAIGIPTSLISDSIAEHRKKSHVKRFKTKKGIENSPETDAVFDLYLDNDLEFLINTQRLLTNDTRLKIMLRSIERREKRFNDIPIEERNQLKEKIITREMIVSENGIIRSHPNKYERVARELRDKEMIKYDRNQVIINDKFHKELNDFISYLKLI